MGVESKSWEICIWSWAFGRKCQGSSCQIASKTLFWCRIYIIKEKLETLTSMESYLPTSDRHAASWIFYDGPSKQLGVVKLRYNALTLFFYNVAILRQRACFRQPLSFAAVSQDSHSASTSIQISKWLYWRYPYWQLGSYDRQLQGMFAHAFSWFSNFCVFFGLILIYGFCQTAEFADVGTHVKICPLRHST